MICDYAVECQGFLSGIDSLILKNHKTIGIKGSYKFKKSFVDLRQQYLNKWFELFPGIHTVNGNLQLQSSIDTLEIKTDFNCLLLKLNETRQYDLKSRLEQAYNEVIKVQRSEIYQIIQFLLLLQKTEQVNIDDLYHFEKVNVPQSLCLYGDSRSLNTSEKCPDVLEFFPDKLFSRNNIHRQFNISTPLKSSSDTDTLTPRFMLELSHITRTRSSIIRDNSSGYCSEVDDKPPEVVSQFKEKMESSVVSYPFSEFCGRSQRFSAYWEDEFLAEWKAFEEGREIPRRFVWEDRGRNVGPEKPRVTEWRPPLPLNSCAISKAVFMSRYYDGDQNDSIKKYLNTDSVPLQAWIKDVVSLRLGISSTTFTYDAKPNRFRLSSDVPKYIIGQMGSHIKAGTIFARLTLLGKKNMFPNLSLIRDRLILRMLDILNMHREILTSLDNDFSSLTELSVYLDKLTNQIEYLGFLFDADPITFKSWPKNMLSRGPLITGGITLLRHLYETAGSQIAHPFLSMTFYLFEGCLNVVLEQLYQWLFQGVLLDRYDMAQANDFIVELNEKYMSNKDSLWWAKGYELSEKHPEVGSCWIFDSLSRDILRCGKSVRLLCLIDETNPLIHHPEIVRHRPSLNLSYSYRKKVNLPVTKYVEIVSSIAADRMRLNKENMEEKRRLLTVKALEAQTVRERFFTKDREERLNKRLESQKMKKIQAETMKEAANNEIMMKKERIDNEKAADRALIERVKEENRDLLEEIKYEMTKLYAKKFADAEAREKLSLEKIRSYEKKLMDIVKQSGYDNVQNGDTVDVIANVIQECVATCMPGIKEESSYVDVANKSGRIDSAYLLSTSLNDETNYGINRDKEQYSIEGFKELKSHGHPSVSTAQGALYPGSNAGMFPDQRFVEDFKEVNDHGHPSVSTAQRALYPRIEPDKDKPSVNVANEFGHPSMSTAQGALYPDSNAGMFPDQRFVEEFKEVNYHGHPSMSTAQGALYPGSNPSGEINSYFVDNFKDATKQRHTSQSSIQQSIYPSSLYDPDSEYKNRNLFFKSINTRGHSSESSIQDLLYPKIPNPKEYQQSNNSSTPIDPISLRLCKENPLINKDASEFINSFYAVDLKKVFQPIDRSSKSFSKEKRTIEDEPIELEDELLETIVNMNLVFPIMSHVKLVDSITINTLINKFHLRDHLKEIRKYLFLQDGHFSSTLLPDVFGLLSSSFERRSIEEVVKSALICNHIEHECFCGNVSASLLSSPDTEQVLFKNKLDRFSISYDIKWPLNIVISEPQMSQYRSIFRAIVQMKYSHWCLSETRQKLKSWFSKTNSSKTNTDLELIRPLYSCLNEMEHWIRCIDSCLGNQVSGSGIKSWKSLLQAIDSGQCSDLDSLIGAHSAYLDDVVIRCLLGGDLTQVTDIAEQVRKTRIRIRKIIVDMLAIICEYHRMTSLHYWRAGDSHNATFLTNVQSVHSKFRKYGSFLLDILKGLPQDSYLSYLLVSLDFNQFYYRPTSV